MERWGNANRSIALALSVLLVALTLIFSPTVAFAGTSPWTPEVSGTNAWLRGVKFIDANRGCVVGEGGTILSTNDGGATWVRQTSGTTNFLFGVDFVDANHGWVVGQYGTLLATTDGGSHWLPQTCEPDPLGTGAWAYDIASVKFLDLNHGVAVGRSRNDAGLWNSRFFTTLDGGVTWKMSSEYAWGLNSISFADSLHGWAVGLWGTLAVTTSAGATWTASGYGGDPVWSAADFSDAARGCLVGMNGLIRTTDDGGASWADQVSGTNQSLRDIRFADAARGWAVGDGGTILSTLDGGSHWMSEGPGVPGDLWGIDFVDASNGWTVGMNGTILRYGPVTLPPGQNTVSGVPASSPWGLGALALIGLAMIWRVSRPRPGADCVT